MKGKRIAFLSLAVLLLNSCSPADPVATATALPTHTVPPAPTESTPPTAVPPIEAPTAAPVAQDTCLDCHTNKQRLIDTAKLEEVVEVESEGVG